MKRTTDDRQEALDSARDRDNGDDPPHVHGADNLASDARGGQPVGRDYSISFRELPYGGFVVLDHRGRPIRAIESLHAVIGFFTAEVREVFEPHDPESNETKRLARRLAVTHETVVVPVRRSGWLPKIAGGRG